MQVQILPALQKFYIGVDVMKLNFIVIGRKAIEVNCGAIGKGNNCLWQFAKHQGKRYCPRNYPHCCIVCPDHQKCVIGSFSYGCATADIALCAHIKSKELSQREE